MRADAIAKFETAVRGLEALAKGGSARLIADAAADLRKAAADFGEVEKRLDRLEKEAADEQAARFGFGAADSDRARHDPAAHVEGPAKTLGLGRATKGAETEQSPSTGRATDWRQ